MINNGFGVAITLAFAGCMFVASVQSQSVGSGVMQEWSRRSGFIDPRKTEAEIVDSWQGGAWGSKGLSGHFRFFLTQSTGGSANNLYVQWFAGEGEAEEVFYSISIDELNSLPRYRFGLPVCLQPDCREMKISAEDIFEAKQLEFDLVLEGVGQYRMRL